MKKYIVLTLLFLSLLGMNISVQAMQGGGKSRRGEGGGEETSATKCAICQGEEKVDLQTLGCGHEFHAECLGGYIQSAFGSGDTNFDRLKCPLFSSACVGVLTREQIDRFTSSSSSSPAATPGNTAILAFFDQRADERANPPVVVVIEADAAELAEIKAGNLQICPGCSRRAHRLDGCNHMTCSTGEGGCGVHYCYPCGKAYNRAINGGQGWEARACACPHYPGWAPEPIPVPGAHGAALQQANPIALINAAALGDLFTVRALLAMPQADVNTPSPFGMTALHWAAENGHLAVVQALLAAPGIQVNTQNAHGNTALHWAARQGHLAVVQALLEAPGIQVNTPDHEGLTPLHWAAEQGNLAVVNALLRAGAGVNIQDASGNTALHNAAREGHLPVVNALLATPGILVNRQNARDWTAFDVAAHYGHLPVFQALLAAGADVSTPDTDGNTALHRAAREGRLRVVQALIAAGADIIIQDANGQTALQLATRNGHLAVVAALR